MAYLLDSNVFIEAKNAYYGFDFCPGFWEWLSVKNKAGKVFSIEKVGDEIISGNDQLAEWAEKKGGPFFLKPDTAMLPALGKVSEWANGQQYQPVAVKTFLELADYYLVGYALAHSHTVVTREIASTSVKKIKIPDACIGLGVKFITPFEMLRREKARFILSQ